MKNKRNVLYSLIVMLAGVSCFPIKAQQKNGVQEATETKNASTFHGTKSMVRTIKQDQKGNIWITSGEGVFKYDGKSFTNITGKVSSARFFSVLEDRKGNFWFATIGSGVYDYDGNSFRNFTTKNGLASDRVGHIYEDKNGNIWFGTENGASRYDGKSFQNFKMNEALPRHRLILSIFQLTSNRFQKTVGCIMMLMLSLKIKQENFGSLQGVIFPFTMGKNLPQ